MDFYDFEAVDAKGDTVSMDKYKGDVVLVVNTATECGFTPQYKDLEKLYKKDHEKGFEILDFPCNQFGGQAPGTIEEIGSFCTLKYGTTFPRFEKVDVNGANALPLFTWLKEQKGFQGFDPANKLTPVLEDMLGKADPNYAASPDIKWNFTKFLIDRDGNVVARFEPTTSMETVDAEVEKLL